MENLSFYFFLLQRKFLSFLPRKKPGEHEESKPNQLNQGEHH